MIDQWFPRLKSLGYRITSPESNLYNCVAWAVPDSERWWWPDPMQLSYWPSAAPREETMEAFIEAFHTLGYTPCSHGASEPGFEKIALFVDSVGKPAHAARQLPSGKWTSKLGAGPDIEHTLEGLAASPYGTVAQFLKRPRGKTNLIEVSR